MNEPIKREVIELLRRREFDALVARCDTDTTVWREVRHRFYDLDERIRWSAIETAARLMKKWWDAGKEERVRIYVRTLFWTLNDESGGIGWSSAQAIAEIIALIPSLIEPYGRMMIAHCIDEPPLLKGCFWGIGRVGALMRDAADAFAIEIVESLRGAEVDVLGTAAWAMGETQFAPGIPFLTSLFERDETVAIYVGGILYEKPLRIWAEEAIQKIRHSTSMPLSSA